MGDDDRRRSRASRRWARGPRSWSLATQLFAFQAAVILVVLLGTGLAAFSNASTANSDAAQDEVLGIAHTLAAAPVVVSGLSAPDPTSVLQPLAEQVQRDTGTDFVVVMTPEASGTPIPILRRSAGGSAARSPRRWPAGPSSRRSPAPSGPRYARWFRSSSPGGSPASWRSAGR